MRLNWVGYDFSPYDGYGRYSVNFIRALTHRGIEINPIVDGQFSLPMWMQRLAGIDWSRLTISCIPPSALKQIPGRQWALSMTEGSLLPAGWADSVNETCERVIVPCKHNKECFERSGVEKPVHVIPGGTSPAEFPLMSRNGHRPGRYLFLALGDRGSRKGWTEVWTAFFQAFGSPDDTSDVGLITKARPNMNDMYDAVAGAVQKDPRISFWKDDVPDMADVYALVDCFAIPSRSEGWGMPHREAAMMGIPVITTKFSGTDDGHTEEWSIVVEHGELENVPACEKFMAGQWVRANIDDLAQKMRWCYENQAEANKKGQAAAQWLRANQTWDHSAEKLLELIKEYA